MRLGVSPRQRVRVVLTDPMSDDEKDAEWDGLFQAAKAMNDYAKSQGMTEEKLRALMRDD
ncbi:MAG: hypothetical protein HQM08_31005 [Candidatus Riflebacteria bacterium]|nr:hypothetical protein [Candidatus Riflebacteria bacterium]